MAGEYQLAQRLIDEGLSAASADPAMDGDVLARALMTQLLEHYKTSRVVDDIVSELEQHIQSLLEGDEHVVTRGC